MTVIIIVINFRLLPCLKPLKTVDYTIVENNSY